MRFLRQYITMNPLFALCQFPQSRIVGSERTETELEAQLIENQNKPKQKKLQE